MTASVARCAGFVSSVPMLPRARGLALGTRRRPLRGLPSAFLSITLTQPLGAVDGGRWVTLPIPNVDRVNSLDESELYNE